MMERKSKKMTILYVLKMLQEGTNKFHPITQSLITKVINNLGIKCDRRTVAKDVDLLIEHGYKIVKIKGGGCYMNDDNIQFQRSDFRQIVDCVAKSDLDEVEKGRLLKKLANLINVVDM